MADKTNPQHIQNQNVNANPRPEINTKDSNWGWFSVWSPKQGSTRRSSINPSSVQSQDGNLEFEVVQQDVPSKSYTASHDHMLLENNFQINDQYVNLNEYGTTLPVIPIDDDQKDKDNDNNNDNDNVDIGAIINGDNGDNGDDTNNINISQSNESQLSPNEDVNDDKTANVETEAVMISQTLTLRSRNEELEKERDELHSETLQLRMQTQCLQQTNDHIIAAQGQQIQILQDENDKLQTALHIKDEALKKAQEELARIQRERDNLKKKLHDICYNRLSNSSENTHKLANTVSNNVDINNSQVLINNKGHIIYGCIQCGTHLFDSSAMIQRQIEIDDNTFGCLVDSLFNSGDTTMGPTVCKTFLNGMFKVKEIFCDGCLSTFGWKIIESFDEWNTFHQNKYCIDISNIKQISASNQDQDIME